MPNTGNRVARFPGQIADPSSSRPPPAIERGSQPDVAARPLVFVLRRTVAAGYAGLNQAEPGGPCSGPRSANVSVSICKLLFNRRFTVMAEMPST
jgi:hypothetical protein